MPIVTIDMAKRHLDVLHDDEDYEIHLYLSAAEGLVAGYIDRRVYGLGDPMPAEGEDGYDAYNIRATPAIQTAILLMVSEFYNKREPAGGDGNAVLPLSVRSLLAEHRVWRA